MVDHVMTQCLKILKADWGFKQAFRVTEPEIEMGQAQSPSSMSIYHGTWLGSHHHVLMPSQCFSVSHNGVWSISLNFRVCLRFACFVEIENFLLKVL